jgi:hypothetical protein
MWISTIMKYRNWKLMNVGTSAKKVGMKNKKNIKAEKRLRRNSGTR